MKSLRRNDGLCSNCEAAPTNRRDFLARSGLGIGSLGLVRLNPTLRPC